MISLKTIFNPQSNIGQLLIVLFFVVIGGLGTIMFYIKYVQAPCPPSTAINNDIQTKGNSKKGGTTTIDLGLTNDQSDTDCYTREELLEMGVKQRQLDKAGVQ